MLSALVSMTVDGFLDRRNILLGNGSFSDGKRQHFDCIAERILGRQQKMKGNEKKLTADRAGTESGRIRGLKCKTLG